MYGFYFSIQPHQVLLQCLAKFQVPGAGDAGKVSLCFVQNAGKPGITGCDLQPANLTSQAERILALEAANGRSNTDQHIA